MNKRIVSLSIIFACLSPLHPAQLQQVPQENLGHYGNGFKKLEWQKMAAEKIAEIENICYTLEEYDVQQYSPLYERIDEQCNAFYKKIGTSRSEISTLLKEVQDDLVEALKKSLTEDTDDINEKRVDAEQKAFQLERDIKEAEFDVKQLEADMNLVETFDKELNARHKRVQELLSMALQKKSEALDIFQVLEEVYSDRIAREKYYQIAGIAEQLKKLQLFFTQTFWQDSQDVVQKATQQMQQVESSIKQFEEKGAVINNRTVVLEELKIKKEEEERLKLEEEKAAQEAYKAKKIFPIKGTLSASTMLLQTIRLTLYVITSTFSDWYHTIRTWLGLESPIEEKKADVNTVEVEPENQDSQITEVEAPPAKKQKT